MLPSWWALGWRTVKILQMRVQACTHTMEYGQPYTGRVDSGSAAWHLTEVGPMRILVIMQRIGMGLCQRWNNLFPHLSSIPTHLYFWTQEPRDGQKHSSLGEGV